MWFLAAKLWLLLFLANLTNGQTALNNDTAATDASLDIDKDAKWLSTPKIGIPGFWSSKELADDSLMHELDQHCPADFRLPKNHPLFVALDQRVELSHACAPMRLYPGIHIHAFWCRKKVDKKESFCLGRQVAWSIVRVLPTDLVRTIAAHGGMNTTELIARIEDDLTRGSDDTRHYQLLWLERNSKDRAQVCWPRRPGFTPEQFTDVLGYLSAMLTMPETIGAAAPKRFMDFPPGPVRQDVYHQIDWKSCHSSSLLTLIRTEFLRPGAYIGTSAARDEIDKWSGVVGRALLATLFEDDYYDCPRDRDCFAGAATNCNLPIKPDSAKDMLRLFTIALELRMPLTISWHSAKGPRPPGIWVMIYRASHVY
ncbi:hypothetical protein CDD82_783 [Ophiocordyceps australis]|uniref:Uncharacterized protein n=1 Tax=Ophiocordyceps australis TaxID=1399860 RepID=A0A2C5ZN42_9HYPO|nr:hypothetical protein CDD82_783 [Ophiocordyceps australis]